jgi:hypothetical protein
VEKSSSVKNLLRGFEEINNKSSAQIFELLVLISS